MLLFPNTVREKSSLCVLNTDFRSFEVNLLIISFITAQFVLFQCRFCLLNPWFSQQILINISSSQILGFRRKMPSEWSWAAWWSWHPTPEVRGRPWEPWRRNSQDICWGFARKGTLQSSKFLVSFWETNTWPVFRLSIFLNPFSLILNVPPSPPNNKT